MTKVVGVIGGTGRLARLIVNHLLDMPSGVRVRVMVRSGSEGKVEDLRSRGVDVVVGDLNDQAALDKLSHGAYSIICAAIGGRDVTVTGQQQALQACVRNGVQRFIPSDFSFDFFKVARGLNYNSDARTDFAALADKEKGNVQVVHFLNGCFMDKEVLWGFLGAFDFSKQEYHVWGDGETPCQFTTYDDSAHYVAEVAVADSVPDIVSVAADTKSMNQVAQLYEASRKVKLNRVNRGSLQDMDQHIEDLKQKNPDNLYAYLALTYYRPMLGGEATMKPLHNSLFPTVKPMTIEQYLAVNKDF